MLRTCSIATLLIGTAMQAQVMAAGSDLLCLQGKSFEKDREFLQIRQLKVHWDGDPPGPLLKPLVKESARQKLWPGLKASELTVMDFDSGVCGDQPVAELTLNPSALELAAIEAEVTRGPLDWLQLTAVSSRAVSVPAPSRDSGKRTQGSQRHDWLRIFFATNRKASGSPSASKAFGSEQSDVTNFGSVDISIPADHRWANLESPSLLRFEWSADRERHVVLGDAYQTLPLKDWQNALARKAGAFDKPGVLLFVHGYNNTFEEAAQRAAQLAYDLSFAGPVVLYSWPSDGDLWGYIHDEEKARTAWRQMAEVLDVLTKLAPGAPVHVIAHSMGNRVLTQGMAELVRSRPGAKRVFREVVLASPDIGEKEFSDRWKFELSSSSYPRFTLYASKQDLPVAWSEWLHGQPRVGSGGRTITVLPGLDSVDATDITKEWFGLSHSYFGDNATVMSDLFLLINQSIEPSKRPRLTKAQGTHGEYWEFRQ